METIVQVSHMLCSMMQGIKEWPYRLELDAQCSIHMEQRIPNLNARHRASSCCFEFTYPGSAAGTTTAFSMSTWSTGGRTSSWIWAMVSPGSTSQSWPK